MCSVSETRERDAHKEQRERDAHKDDEGDGEEEQHRDQRLRLVTVHRRADEFRLQLVRVAAVALQQLGADEGEEADVDEGQHTRGLHGLRRLAQQVVRRQQRLPHKEEERDPALRRGMRCVRAWTCIVQENDFRVFVVVESVAFDVERNTEPEVARHHANSRVHFPNKQQTKSARDTLRSDLF